MSWNQLNCKHKYGDWRQGQYPVLKSHQYPGYVCLKVYLKTQNFKIQRTCRPQRYICNFSIPCTPGFESLAIPDTQVAPNKVWCPLGDLCGISSSASRNKENINSVFYSLQRLHHIFFIFPRTLSSRYYYHHFTNEETLIMRITRLSGLSDAVKLNSST